MSTADEIRQAVDLGTILLIKCVGCGVARPADQFPIFGGGGFCSHCLEEHERG